MIKEDLEILIVEDNDQDAKLLVRIIKENFPHARIETCKDGMQAYNMIKLKEASVCDEARGHVFEPRFQKGYDILLIDQHLGHETFGTSILDKIRLDARFKALPVLFVSGDCMVATLKESRPKEIQFSLLSAIKKPYDAAEVIREMSRLVNG